MASRGGQARSAQVHSGQQRLRELLRGGRHRRSAAVPSAEPAGAHGPSPRSHPPQSPGWGSPPCSPSPPPLTSRFRGQHSPVRLPEAAQTTPTARLAPGRCPQRPPFSSSSIPRSGFSRPWRPLGLSPPSSRRSSPFICLWLTADLSPAAATQDPWERMRTPCPPPRSARRADPPWLPADRPHPPAVPQPPPRGQTRLSRHPLPSPPQH